MGVGGAHGEGAGPDPRHGVGLRIFWEFNHTEPCDAPMLCLRHIPAASSALPCPLGVGGERRAVFLWALEWVGVVDFGSWGLEVPHGSFLPIAFPGVHGRLFGFGRRKLCPLQWFPVLFREKGSLWRDGPRRAERSNGYGRITPLRRPGPNPESRPSAKEISRTCRPTTKSPRTFLPQASPPPPPETIPRPPPSIPPLHPTSAFISTVAGWDIMTGFMHT